MQAARSEQRLPARVPSLVQPPAQPTFTNSNGKVMTFSPRVDRLPAIMAMWWPSPG